MNNLLSYTIPNHMLTSMRLADIIDIVGENPDIFSELNIIDPHTQELRATYYYGISYRSLPMNAIVGDLSNKANYINLRSLYWNDHSGKIDQFFVPYITKGFIQSRDMILELRKVVAYRTPKIVGLMSYASFGGFIHHTLGKRDDPYYTTSSIQKSRYNLM